MTSFTSILAGGVGDAVPVGIAVGADVGVGFGVELVDIVSVGQREGYNNSVSLDK